MICILTSNIAQIPPLKGLQIWSCHLHLGQMNQVTGGSTAQKTSEKVSPGSNQKTPRIFPRKLPNSFPAVGSHPISWGCRPIQRSSPLLFLICTGCPACTNPQKWQDAGGWKPFLLWLRRLFVEPIPLGYIHYMCIYKCIEIYTCTYIYTLIYILYIYIYTCQCTYFLYKAATTPQACITASGFKSSIPSIGSKFQNLWSTRESWKETSPSLPKTSSEGVLGMLLGSKYLLTRFWKSKVGVFVKKISVKKLKKKKKTN